MPGVALEQKEPEKHLRPRFVLPKFLRAWSDFGGQRLTKTLRSSGSTGGETSPVCEQEYPVEETRRRLEQLVAEAPQDEQPAVFAQVDTLAERVAALEHSLSALTASLAESERATADQRVWREELARRLE